MNGAAGLAVRGYARRVKETLEREVKLAPATGSCCRSSAASRCRRGVFVSTYHDTPDLVLARHGVTLRHRVEDGTGLWQLKLPRGRGADRARAAGPPARPPLELSSLLVAFLRGRELVPVARLRTRREVVRADGAEIVDDSVSVLGGPARDAALPRARGRAPRRRRAHAAPAREGAAQAGASSGEQRPKLFQALDLGRAPSPPSVPRGAPPAEALGLALGRAGAAAPAPRPGHAPRLRPGGPPPDARRDAPAPRVPARRRPLLDADVVGAAARRARAGSGGALGPARDLDVLVEHLRGRDRGARRRRRRRGASLLARSRTSGPPRGAPSSRRSRAIATSRCSTGSTTSASPSCTGTRVSARGDSGASEWKRATQGARAASTTTRPTTSCTRRASGSSARATRPSSPRTSSGRTGERFATRPRRAAGRPRRAPGRRRRRGAHPRLGRAAPAARRRGGSARRASASVGPQGGGRVALARGAGRKLRQGGEAARVSVVRAAGGVPVRDGAARARGARRPPPDVRRLDVPEGQVRAGRERRGVRAARGRGGDRSSLRARGRAALDVLRTTSQGRPKSVRYWRLRVVGGEPSVRPRGRRGALGLARRGRGAADVRARPDRPARAGATAGRTEVRHGLALWVRRQPHPAVVGTFARRCQRRDLHDVPGRQVLRPRAAGAVEHLALVPARGEDRRARAERRRQVDAAPDHGRARGAVVRRRRARPEGDGRVPAAGAGARRREGRARQRRGRRPRAPRPARPLQRGLRRVRRARRRLRRAARRAGEGAGPDRPRRRLEPRPARSTARWTRSGCPRATAT